MNAKLFKVFIKDTCFTIEEDKNSQQNPGTAVGQIKKALFTDAADASFTVSSFEEWKEEVLRFFLPAPAAGGLVQNTRGEYLWIFRRGRYDLPKGKLDPGETFEHAALREVEEECGIRDLRSGPLLGYTYHIYIQNEKPYFKETAWYLMHTAQEQVEIQLEEDITGYCWADAKTHRELTAKTFRSLKDFLGDLRLS